MCWARSGQLCVGFAGAKSLVFTCIHWSYRRQSIDDHLPFLSFCADGSQPQIVIDFRVKPRVKDLIREIFELLVTADDTNHVQVEALIFKKAISLSRDRLHI